MYQAFRLFPNILKRSIQLGFVATLAYQQQKIHCTVPYFSVISHTELQQLRLRFPNLFILEKQKIDHMISILRSKDTNTADYRLYADRIIRLLLERAILENERKIEINSELHFEQTQFSIVTLVRSGNAYLSESLKMLPGASVGFILITKNEETEENQLIYTKLPADIANKKVLLVDAILSSGERSTSAIKSLMHHGIKEENITLISILSAERNITKLLHTFPKIKLVTAAVDHILDTAHEQSPGIGDFGDRYFGTS